MLLLFVIPLFFALPNPLAHRLIRELHNAGHSGLFFCLQMLLLFCGRLLFRRTLTYWGWLACISCAVFLACLMELVQYYVGRIASVSDLIRDGFGIVAASACYFACTKRRTVWQILACIIIVGAMIMASLKSAWPWLQARWLLAQQFPVLMNAEQPNIHRYIHGLHGSHYKVVPAPPAWAGNGTQVLDVALPNNGRYPGFKLRSPYSDWSGYNRLDFEVFSPKTQALKVEVNIFSVQDGKALRATLYSFIVPGANLVSLELSSLKTYNPKSITGVEWRALDASISAHLWFDNIRLLYVGEY